MTSPNESPTRLRSTTRPPVHDSPPCAPRSPRRSSARTPPSAAWSSRCCAAATCCSRACRASPRRCWCAPWPASLDVETKRVQFTPDLMPGDITGLDGVRRPGRRVLVPRGPGVHQPAAGRRDQPDAAQDPGVAARGDGGAPGVGRRLPAPLPDPFLVVATQNPVEYEGTYPLPEAQLDRFLLKLVLPMPERDEEIEVLTRHAAGFDPRDLAGAGVRPVAGPATSPPAQAEVGRVQVAPEVLGYTVDICRATRQSPSLSLGVSPRGATALLRDVPRLGVAVRSRLRDAGRRQGAGPRDARHRVELRPEAELEGVDGQRCWPRRSARSRSPADGGDLARGRVPLRSASGWCPWCCARPGHGAAVAAAGRAGGGRRLALAASGPAGRDPARGRARPSRPSRPRRR